MNVQYPQNLPNFLAKPENRPSQEIAALTKQVKDGYSLIEKESVKSFVNAVPISICCRKNNGERISDEDWKIFQENFAPLLPKIEAEKFEKMAERIELIKLVYEIEQLTAPIIQNNNITASDAPGYDLTKKRTFTCLLPQYEPLLVTGPEMYDDEHQPTGPEHAIVARELFTLDPQTHQACKKQILTCQPHQDEMCLAPSFLSQSLISNVMAPPRSLLDDFPPIAEDEMGIEPSSPSQTLATATKTNEMVSSSLHNNSLDLDDAQMVRGIKRGRQASPKFFDEYEAKSSQASSSSISAPTQDQNKKIRLANQDDTTPQIILDDVSVESFRTIIACLQETSSYNNDKTIKEIPLETIKDLLKCSLEYGIEPLFSIGYKRFKLLWEEYKQAKAEKQNLEDQKPKNEPSKDSKNIDMKEEKKNGSLEKKDEKKEVKDDSISMVIDDDEVFQNTTRIVELNKTLVESGKHLKECATLLIDQIRKNDPLLKNINLDSDLILLTQGDIESDFDTYLDLYNRWINDDASLATPAGKSLQEIYKQNLAEGNNALPTWQGKFEQAFRRLIAPESVLDPILIRDLLFKKCESHNSCNQPYYLAQLLASHFNGMKYGREEEREDEIITKNVFLRRIQYNNKKELVLVVQPPLTKVVQKSLQKLLDKLVVEPPLSVAVQNLLQSFFDTIIVQQPLTTDEHNKILTDLNQLIAKLPVIKSVKDQLNVSLGYIIMQLSSTKNANQQFHALLDDMKTLMSPNGAKSQYFSMQIKIEQDPTQLLTEEFQHTIQSLLYDDYYRGLPYRIALALIDKNGAPITKPALIEAAQKCIAAEVAKSEHQDKLPQFIVGFIPEQKIEAAPVSGLATSTCATNNNNVNSSSSSQPMDTGLATNTTGH